MDPNNTKTADTLSSQTPPATSPQSGADAGTPPVPQTPPPSSGSTTQPLPSTPSSMPPPPSASPASPTPPASPSVPPKAKSHKALFLVIILLVIVFSGGLLLAFWYFQGQTHKQSVQEQAVVLPKPVVKPLIIGSDATYPPMESVDKTGKFVGYDIDLANLIAKELGTTANFKTVKFDNIFDNLDKKQYDMIISSVTITEERKKKYAFSDPYINAGEVVITRKESSGSAAPLLTAKDLQGKKIGVEQGTVEVANAKKLTLTDLVMQYPSNDPALTDLVSGKIDAVLTDLPNAKGIISANPLLRIASDPLTDEYYGIAFRKGDPMVSRINQVLSTLSVKGILTDLKQKWLD